MSNSSKPLRTTVFTMVFEGFEELDMSHKIQKSMLFYIQKLIEKMYHFCIDFGINFGSILVSKLMKKSITKQQENMLENYFKKSSILRGFGKGLGSLLGAFGTGKTSILGAFSEYMLRRGF